MSKPKGNRRQTIRAYVKQRQAGGILEECDGCGQVVAFADAVYLSLLDRRYVYCRPCATALDPYGVVQLLWDNSEWADGTPTDRSEGGREVVPPS